MLSLITQHSNVTPTGKEVLHAFKALVKFDQNEDGPGLNASVLKFHKPFAQQRAALGTCSLLLLLLHNSCTRWCTRWYLCSTRYLACD